MIDTKNYFEKMLQNMRFSKVKPYLRGDVLDFGGNEGELGTFVKGRYDVVNYDHSKLKKIKYDIIVSLAVFEHMEIADVYNIVKTFSQNNLKKGSVLFLTTPTPASKPVLEFLAAIGILQKSNIEEHKHYWNKKELYNLAETNGLTVKKYRKFQFGFNQYAIFIKP
jgi:2-polyprenyl-3-methyl-5-hydroxy-6-metoxy-1,4-benzoquinol methylase